MTYNRPLLILCNFAFVLIFSITSTGCKKNPDVSPSIIGKWSRVAYQNRIIYEVNGTKYDQTGKQSTAINGVNVEFKENGGLVWSGITTQRYTLQGNQLSIIDGANTTKWNAEVTDDQLTLMLATNSLTGNEMQKLADAKGFAAGVNGGNGAYTKLNVATKALEVYAGAVYQRAK